MNAKDLRRSQEADGEIAVLIATLNETGRRLEKLTAGEVDSVTDYDGRTLLLPRAQEQLRHSAAAKLAASESRFRVLIEHLSDVILLVRPDGVMTYVSPGIKELGGYEPDELVGRSFLELIHPDDMPATLEDMKGILCTPGKSLRTARRCRNKAGTWRTLETVSKNMLHLPEIASVVLTVRDVTERKMAEEVLTTRAAELERFHRLSVGRELQMIELKKEVNALCVQAQQNPPYKVRAP